MCVGRCGRLFIVHTVVVCREVVFFFSLPLSELVPAQRSESSSRFCGEQAPERQGWICLSVDAGSRLREKQAPGRQGKNCLSVESAIGCKKKRLLCRVCLLLDEKRL